ncbi:hypothetical protein [Gaetbulibacter jejuensis]|uniref:Uncharacterized protein n=1 Tax=Gaetbulibacter jejuensis TaxID=584607 RepID=A0ABN1JUT7_9FLAO
MKTQLTIYTLLISFFSLAQVGINTDTPNQALDVNGKIKIGNDGTTPTEGTVRYSATGDFEGYTANGWTSLTTSENNIFPNQGTAVYGYSFAISPGSFNQLISIERFDDLSSLTSIPNDKFLLVTSIVIEPNGLNASGKFEATIGRAPGGFISQYSAIRLNGEPKSRIYQDPYGILMVVRGGEVLRISNETSSDFSINVKIRGFLVDSL